MVEDPALGVLFVGLAGQVQAYNTSSGALVYQNSTIGCPCTALALDTGAATLWVALPASNSAIALVASTLQASGAVLHLRLSPSEPLALVYDPASETVFGINSTTDEVAQFDGVSGAPVSGPIPAGKNVSALVFDPADSLVYAAGDDLSAIVPATMKIASVAPLAPHAHLGGVVFEPSREAIYVGTWTTSPFSGSLSVVNASTAASSDAGLTVLPTGFAPVSLAALGVASGGLPDSGPVVVANEGSGTLSVVASPPAIVSAGFTPSTVDENATTVLAVTAVGGAGPTTLSYGDLPAGCRSEDTRELTCVPAKAGDYVVRVSATDPLGENATSFASLTVQGALRLSADVELSPDGEADVDLPVTMIASAANGTEPYHYAWNFDDGTVGTGHEVNHTFSETGEYVVQLTVTDQGGGSVVVEKLVDVVAQPTVVVSASPGDATDVGVNVTLEANVSGGAGPGSSLWNLGDGAHASTASTLYAWPTASIYDVGYVYTDAFGETATGSLTMIVNAKLTGEFSVVPASSSPQVGTLFTYTATPAGGTSPYTVEWSFGDGSTAAGASVTHAYASAGSYTVQVSIVDGVGETVGTTFKDVDVAARSSGASAIFGGGFGPSFVLGLLLGAAAASVALFVAERRRKAGPPGPPSPYVPPPTAELRGRS